MIRLLPLAAIAFALLASTATAGAQTAPPGTDVYLAALTVRDGRIQVGDPVNITRRAGYDNQPSFTPDGGAVLYTSEREDGQTDIYRYEIARGATVRVTRTPESEYSPTVTPDGRGISAIRVEADSTQRLWRFTLEGDDPRLVLTDLRPVGYHAWGDEHTLALFVLGSPPTLRLADARSGGAEILAEDIGRSLHRIPGRRAISFLHRTPDGERWIKALDLETREIRPLVRPLEGGEDYVWTPGGVALMARGSTLFRWDPAGGEGWQEVADFAAAGVRGITRLAVSPRGDRIALVAEDGTGGAAPRR